MNTYIARDRFPVLAAGALAAVMILAFGRTFYVKFLFDLPPLSRMAVLHGILATLWLGLHVTQARLVAAHRVDIHRNLGIVAALVGVALAVQALDLGITRVATGHAPPGRDPLQFLSVPIGTTTMFVLFLSGALVLRKKKEWHKRLMLLATMSLLVPAAGRLDSLVMLPLGLPRGLIALLLTGVFVAWAWVHDWRKRGRVHAAYFVGGLALLVSLPLRMWIGYTDAWRPIAEWIVGFAR
jgi:hypothetical protein